MGKFAEADNRMFKNIFVCRRCKSKMKAPILKVLAGKVSCRQCSTKKLRVKRKK